jgi:hypothetical protein
VFTKPVGGGVVVGAKAFFFVTNYVNSAPVGGGTSVTIELGASFGVPNDNVTAFLKVSVDGEVRTFAATDTVNGAFDVTGNHHGNHSIDVWYVYSLNLTQTQHTHTLGSSATGVTVSDSGHSHGVTDTGHNHTQNGHNHTLSS